MLSKFARFAPFLLVIIAITASVLYLHIQPKSEDTHPLHEEILKGKILSILQEEKTVFDNREYLSQHLQVEVISGSIKDQIITVETSLVPKFNPSKYQENEKILLGYVKGSADSEDFYVIGYERTGPLMFLVALFIALSILIARKKSMYSLLGMGVSLLFLIVFVLPAIVNQSNPFVTSMIGMIIMTPVLYYISHGVSIKTTAAVIGTIITLAATAVLSIIFVSVMNLSGITFDEVETLLYLSEGNFDLQGILLAGILMGTLGVIDDVAMTQTSIVTEMYLTDKTLSRAELIHKAMNVGRDHIASVINTLILVYVGGSLTTLLLFTEFPRPLIVLLNSEVVLIPVVVALIGSIGLILAIPITTTLSAILITRQSSSKK